MSAIVAPRRADIGAAPDETAALKRELRQAKLRIETLETECEALRRKYGEFRRFAAPSHSPDAELELTKTEARIAGVLVKRRVASRQAIVAELAAKSGRAPGPTLLGVHMFNLRQKLAARGVAIETVRGSGFRLREGRERLGAMIGEENG